MFIRFISAKQQIFQRESGFDRINIIIYKNGFKANIKNTLKWKTVIAITK
jgi:hypothetical protein